MFMNLNDITKEYKPVYPEEYNWDSTLNFLLSDPTEAEIIYSLASILLKGEKFRKPIVLYSPKVEDKMFDFDDFPHVSDGTHRICAHIISGITEVYVKFYEERDFEFDETLSGSSNDEAAVNQDLILETLITVDIPKEDEEILFDFICDELRSLEISDTLWIVSDVSSMFEGVVSLAWDSNLLEPEIIDAINTKVLNVLVAKKFPFEKYTVVTKVTDYSII